MNDCIGKLKANGRDLVQTHLHRLRWTLLFVTVGLSVCLSVACLSVVRSDLSQFGVFSISCADRAVRPGTNRGLYHCHGLGKHSNLYLDIIIIKIANSSFLAVSLTHG